MKRGKSALKKLLCPGRFPVLLIVIAGGASLYLTFRTWLGETPFAYVSYLLSAYGLAVLVAAIVPLLSSARSFLHSIPLAHRYLTDQHFSVWCGLAISFAVNLGFAVLKLVYAAVNSSFWDSWLAVYNLLLCGVRLFLIVYVRGNRRMRDSGRELACYRDTGFFLVVLDLALSVIATQIVIDGYGYHYPGMLIYAMAAYAFYSLTLAIINIIRYRKLRNPILSAVKAVNLTTALVAIFNLETAMLAQFGTDAGGEFRFVMTAVTAFAVCAIVLGMAVYMVLHSRAEWKRAEQTRQRRRET